MATERDGLRSPRRCKEARCYQPAAAVAAWAVPRVPAVRSILRLLPIAVLSVNAG